MGGSSAVKSTTETKNSPDPRVTERADKLMTGFLDYAMSTGTELSANVGFEFSLGDGVGRWISRCLDPGYLFRVGGHDAFVVAAG